MLTRDIFEKTTRHFLGPITPLLDDPSVSEVMINGPSVIYCERQGKLEKCDIVFDSDADLMAAVRNIAEFVGRDIESGQHSLDARLPDGSRVHIILPPCSRVGICLTIRKFRKSSFDIPTLVEWKSLTEQQAAFLTQAVAEHKNILISGGTGTGKTSLLNALSSAISETERIVVIEDSSELQLNQPHTIYLETQPASLDGRTPISIRDLFVDSLRMRPDRIIVGETRRGEALDLVQSMLSGHAGSLTTVHANTPRDALIRLETLCLMSDVSLPINVARMQVAAAINLIVQVTRGPDGARRVTSIANVHDLDPQQQYVLTEAGIDP